VAYLNGSKVLTTGAALTFNGTNLGVGVGTPTFKVDVSTNAVNADGIRVTNTNANGHATMAVVNGSAIAEFKAYGSTIGFGLSGNVGFGSNASDIVIFSDGNLPTGGNKSIQFRAGGYAASNERMRVTTTGLGVGTTNPVVQLQVAGGSSATYTGVTNGVGIQSNSSGSGFITANNVTPADPSAIAISNGANFGFNGATSNFYGMGLGALRDGGYDMWFQTGAANGGGYRWYTVGATERMTLTKGGSLGVGTTQPLRALHVVGLTPVLTAISAYNGAIIENSDNVALTLATGVAREAVISFGDNGNTFMGAVIYSNTTDSLRLRANNGDRVFIASSGNVGINKADPQASLDYRETVNVISTDTTAVASRTYVFTASLTLTLPASPTAGDWVSIVNASGTTTPVIGRNGSNIMSLAEDMTVDKADGASFTLVYADATRGWVINL
jgi:hypothetical protein